MGVSFLFLDGTEDGADDLAILNSGNAGLEPSLQP